MASQEGNNVRVLAGDGNYLFVSSKRTNILKTYATFAAQARKYFKPRWQGTAREHLDAEGFLEFTREATLHHMYFYVVNRMQVTITDSDWEHPSTWRIIQDTVEKRLAPKSARAAALCAQLMGITIAEYHNWLIGEARYLDK
jgi:hypothetical protein